MGLGRNNPYDNHKIKHIYRGKTSIINSRGEAGPISTKVQMGFIGLAMKNDMEHVDTKPSQCFEIVRNFYLTCTLRLRNG